jgi:ubiquinone/menaquinone biosynthesis C-methylase UbiE
MEEELRIKEQKIYNDKWEYLKKNMPSFIDKVKAYVPTRFKFFSNFIKEGDDILDCGCQDGYMLYHLSKLKEDKIKLNGIDISDISIKDAEENLKEFNPHLVCCPIEDIQLCYDTYDVVIASQVLEHLEKPIEGLIEMLEVCKDNGYVIVSVPIGRELYCDNHKHFFSFYDLMELFDQTGFDYRIYPYWKEFKKETYDIFVIVVQKGKLLESDDSKEADAI